jgi:hypothetical protein
MIRQLLGALVGLLVGGPWLAAVGVMLTRWFPKIPRRRSQGTTPRLILLLLLVELRSGQSVLSAMQAVSKRLQDDADLARVVRVATVSGLTPSLEYAGTNLRPIVAQLARAQQSGSPLTSTVRLLLEQDLAATRAQRLARARALPVRLMIPLTLLMLPGLVLMLYGPALFGLFSDLTGSWS